MEGNMTVKTKTMTRWSVATALGAMALTVGAPTLAHAHVGVTGTSTAAGSSTLLTFAFSHGCSGSPTTRVAIQIPEGINTATPTVNPGWDVQKVMVDLATPITNSHGNLVTQRVSEVVYTAKTPIADGLRDTFVISLKLPEDAAGKTLAFPTVQSCEQGEYAWIELAADGQDPHDLDEPAPLLAVTAPESADDGHGGGGHDQPRADHSQAPAAADGGSDQQPLVIASLVVGALGLAAGGTALIRGRSTK